VALDNEIGVRYADVLVEMVPDGADEVDVILVLPVEFVVEFVANDVVNSPPKRTEEDTVDGEIVNTVPFSP
jgi:hypothetical protein